MLFLPAGRAYRAGDKLMICASGGLHRHGTKAVSAMSAKRVFGDADISTTRWTGCRALDRRRHEEAHWRDHIVLLMMNFDTRESPPPPYTSSDPAAVIATPSRAAGEESRALPDLPDLPDGRWNAGLVSAADNSSAETLITILKITYYLPHDQSRHS
ncbi:hypothetical protein CCHR01_19490 [Colletotrichum chrysophilum]|uniref:Uncharacterized protein n=1 Tax=Colletotrichum chrysophilum TaxID=1836956 RepID=A0AAD8ZYI3_9PEZI|nr:hypothetical protein CCHR01_19490 [Colletotrichum chrysophilum]